MTVLRLEKTAEKLYEIEMDIAKQEPKKEYESFRKTLENIIFELNNYLINDICTYFFIASTMLDKAYKIQDYIDEHE